MASAQSLSRGPPLGCQVEIRTGPAIQQVDALPGMVLSEPRRLYTEPRTLSSVLDAGTVQTNVKDPNQN